MSTEIAARTLMGLAGAVLLVPSLWLLYYTYRGNPDPDAPPGRPDRPLTDDSPGSESL